MTLYIETLGRAADYPDFADEDWRGESIIRNVERDRSTGSGKIHYASKPRKKPAPQTSGRICASPCCDNKLSRRNKHGVCKLHVHSAFCSCPQCVNREATRAAREALE